MEWIHATDGPSVEAHPVMMIISISLYIASTLVHTLSSSTLYITVHECTYHFEVVLQKLGGHHLVRVTGEGVLCGVSLCVCVCVCCVCVCVRVRVCVCVVCECVCVLCVCVCCVCVCVVCV